MEIESQDQLQKQLLKHDIVMSKPLGFNNTYILGMKKQLSDNLNINKISDLKKYPELRIGFSNEFIDRADGWPSLKSVYGLSHTDVRGLDHDIAYRGLEAESIDVIDLYATDAEIEYYNITTLRDDLGYFKPYNAVVLFRKDLYERYPDVAQNILNLEDKIDEQKMIYMNSRVKMEGMTESSVASDFLKNTFSIKTKTADETIISRLFKNTADHLILVVLSLFFAIITAVPLGIISYKNDSLGKIVLGLTGIIQTVPSIALLVFMIPFLGIGFLPAVVALFLYSLLPIVRNTYSGLEDVSIDVKESARAIGLPSSARLKLVELPIASRSILAGIKTSAVINVGTATLAALIGAGGFGQPIFTGIRLDDIGLILQGAAPAAVLALIVQGLFSYLEKVVVPKGLRI